MDNFKRYNITKNDTEKAINEQRFKAHATSIVS